MKNKNKGFNLVQLYISLFIIAALAFLFMHFHNKYKITSRDKNRELLTKNMMMQINALQTVREADYYDIESYPELFALLRDEFDFQPTNIPVNPRFYFFLGRTDQLVVVCSEGNPEEMIVSGSEILKNGMQLMCLSNGNLQYVLPAKTTLITYPDANGL